MDKINIFFKNDKVGYLYHKQEEDFYNLEYVKSWKEIGFPLSPTLSLDADSYDSLSIKNFISNLLPEGAPLKELTELYSISKQSKFKLLDKIGKEVSGAFSFTKESENIQETSFREIKQDELVERIERRKEIPITIWDEKPRVSVAGVQDKLPVAIIDGVYGFGEGALASTHILKFGEDKFVYNEYLSLKLAQSAGLLVNDSELITFGTEEVLQVKRFDRELVSSKKIERLHLLDGCQMLNLPPEFKYEKVEVRAYEKVGVNLNKLFNLANITEVPILAKNEIIDWVCINLALANADAHGKNISFLVSKNKIRLAPFYDIMNISLISDIYKDTLAMGIDEEFEILNIKAFDLKEFCNDNKISPKYFNERFITLSNKVLADLKIASKYGFDITIEKKCFHEEYKKNTDFRINRLKDSFHYLLFPELSNTSISEQYVKTNKKKIDKVISKDVQSKLSKSSTIDLYFEMTNPSVAENSTK